MNNAVNNERARPAGEVLDKLCEFFGVELGVLAGHIKDDSEGGQPWMK